MANRLLHNFELNIGWNRNIDDFDSRIVQESAIIDVDRRYRVSAGNRLGMPSSARRNRHGSKTGGSVGDQMALIHDETGSDAADSEVPI
jgi:hypothetical protein